LLVAEHLIINSMAVSQQCMRCSRVLFGPVTSAVTTKVDKPSCYYHTIRVCIKHTLFGDIRM